MRKFNAEWGNLLVYPVFYAGGMIAAPVLGMISGAIWLYGILSLVAVRMLAVAIATIGSKLKPSSVAFLGWFGTRGLASIILGIICLNRVTEIYANSNILLAMIATVLLRVFVQGIIVNPLIRLYAR
jgi:NhaP-type Na+/H+ and K+/H+ antiporter